MSHREEVPINLKASHFPYYDPHSPPPPPPRLALSSKILVRIRGPVIILRRHYKKVNKLITTITMQYYNYMQAPINFVEWHVLVDGVDP